MHLNTRGAEKQQMWSWSCSCSQRARQLFTNRNAEASRSLRTFLQRGASPYDHFLGHDHHDAARAHRLSRLAAAAVCVRCASKVGQFEA